ncbi:MAG TPA: hypothetical protein VGR02_15375 [Thermoanaerobaculia bacterium]|jgi:ABC-type antimicrobial peptide transport system permease subunit|nr:hypothetical protein [Thermoanaerobaculia bacterium]
MLRVLAGIVAGVLLAVGIIIVVEVVSHALYPPPPGMNVEDPAALARAAAQMPPGALLMIILGWTLGTFCGCWLAARIGKRAGPAVTPGVLVFAAAIANMFQIPHPPWFWVVSLLLVAVAAIAGAALGARKPAPLLVR